jgi:acetyl-CoA acyltransferase
MREVVIVAAVRSAVAKGKKEGALANVHAVDLSAHLMKAALDQVDVDPMTIDDVIWGCAMPEATQGLNVARLAWLRAGLPVDVPAATVNRFCSSGLQTIAFAAQEILSGMADVALAGGVEMMSQVPMSGYHTRLDPDLTESYIGMGFTAERVAERWKVTREEQDRWAHGSQQKAAKALAAGAFDSQITPVPVESVQWKGGEKSSTTGDFARDELPRSDTTIEGLAKLRPAFKVNGTVTAGNASPYSDGAAAVLLMTADRAKELGIEPLARFITFAAAGVDPDIMGVGPIKAVPKALKRAGLSLNDVKLIEFNEAFAAQVVAVIRDLGMDPEKVNVNGGAIALGHPLGMSGARLVVSLLHELRRRGGRYGLATLCVGVGQGQAALFERAGAA